MLMVSRGREKARGSGEPLEQTRGHCLPQHPHPSAGLPGASEPHPAPVLTVPVPSEELVAPPCPRQKVWLGARSVPGEAQALRGDLSAGVTPPKSAPVSTPSCLMVLFLLDF